MEQVTTLTIVAIPVASVVIRDDLYPRMATSPEKVQEYADNLEHLPPIEINQDSVLIDGWHRWTAHRKMEQETIAAIITRTASDAELEELAIERNNKHGLQLSREDKRDRARKIYNGTPEKERPAKKIKFMSLFSVSERTVRTWLDRIDKDSKDAARKKAFALWLACHTQEEIAEACDTDQATASRWIDDFMHFGNLAEMHKAAASHATDFTPPLYNIWKLQEKTPGMSHFGNSETRWVDNLLYLYTAPFEVVVDPFAGSGSTLDVCKQRFRRYWVSDRKPIIERETEIRRWDLTDGVPPLHRWQDVKLVYLDPPYWKQAEGKYSQDATDLANMDLETFTKGLAGIIAGFGKKLPTGAVIALLLQPTQWNAPGHAYTDHVADMLKTVKLPLAMRVSCPYESQQANAQMVAYAKEHKTLLVLTRELVIWQVPA